MPIGKNSIKRVANNGYSAVKTTAPDMENSVIVTPEEKPVKTETAATAKAEKPAAKKPAAKKPSTKKPAAKSAGAKKPATKKTTTTKSCSTILPMKSPPQKQVSLSVPSRNISELNSVISIRASATVTA